MLAATGRRPRTRLLWLAHVAVPHGRLYLDQGAVDAVPGGATEAVRATVAVGGAAVAAV